MKRTWWSGLVLCVGLLLASRANAAPPPLLPIQGFLSAPSTSVTPPPGTPLDGSYTIRFRLYDAATAGNTLHDETLDVTVVKGFFTVYLGDTANGGMVPLDLALFRDNPTLYLGIKVGTDTEAAPRLQLATSPYAGAANACVDSETLGGLAAADFASATHAHAYADLTGIPATFPPSMHAHAYADLTGIPASFPPSAHTHAWMELTSVPTEFTPSAHNHSATDINAGTLSDARFSAAADLAAEGFLNNDANTDILVRGQSDMRYASSSHTHGAADIDAYADLMSGGYLDANAPGDLPTIGQLSATGGTINAAGNPLDWSHLKSVPAGFADGADADTTYSALAGGGITVNAMNQVSVDGAVVARKDAAAGNQAFDTSTLFLDYTNNRVGVGNAAPTQALVVSGVVRASGDVTTASEFRYTAARTYYAPVTVYDFVPAFVTTDADIYRYDYSGYLGSRAAGTTLWLTAPVRLPHGATVTGLTCYYLDQSAAADFTGLSADLRHEPYGTTSSSNVASASASGLSGLNSGTVQQASSAAVAHTVNNATSAYLLTVNMTVSTATDYSTVNLRGCRISYTMTTLAP